VANLHAQLASMDWLAPWWKPWRAVGQQVALRVLAGARLCDALNAEQEASGKQHHRQSLGTTPTTDPPTNNAPTQPIQFVPQSTLPERVAYEAFIFESGQVPTRENLHDFFNGLAWLVFPHTKRRLNALQYGELAAGGVQATRGALRDALTLFDENAAIWPCASGAALSTAPCTALSAATGGAMQLVDALRAKQWQRAFVDLRAQWQGNPPVLFGHALLEKLVTPYKSITAHVYITQAATEAIAITELDKTTALQLKPAALATKPFIPLPVLGVPGWWAANEDPAFYDDTHVFRAPREVTLSNPNAAPKP
jgi:Protein of unknown function (DUF3025)